MNLQTLIEVGSASYVALSRGRETLNEIDILHEGVPLRECAVRRFGGQPSLKLPSGRPVEPFHSGLPAEALAKAGGGQGS